MTENMHDVPPVDGRHPEYPHLVMCEVEAHYGSWLVTFPGSAEGSLLMTGDDIEHMFGSWAENAMVWGYGYVNDEYLGLVK